MTGQKTVITIRGPANSGKTTLANVMAAKIIKEQNMSAMMVSQDYIRHEMLRMPKSEQRAASIDLMKKLTAYASGHVDVLVIEGILSAAHHEDFLEYVKALYGHGCHSYYIDLSLEETRRRYRKKPREEYEIDCLDQWYGRVDLSAVLEETVLDGRKTTDQLAERIYHDLMERK